jgi:hypothetical protein
MLAPSRRLCSGDSVSLNRLLATAAAGLAMVCAAGLPSASAAPASDAAGYVDSVARCTSAATTVVFGSTDSSRVAICKTAAGQYEYRGVRLRDGAKLIVPASASGDGFTADNDGISYAVTAKSPVISMGDKVIRDEPMVDFHRADAPAPTPTTPLPPPLPAEVGGKKSS